MNRAEGFVEGRDVLRSEVPRDVESERLGSHSETLKSSFKRYRARQSLNDERAMG